MATFNKHRNDYDVSASHPRRHISKLPFSLYFESSFPLFRLGKTSVCSAIIKDMKGNQLLRRTKKRKERSKFLWHFDRYFYENLIQFGGGE